MIDPVTVLVSFSTRLLALIPWHLVPLQPVNPPRSNGFAGSVVAALMAMALLAIVAKFATTRPKGRRRPRR